MIVMMSWIGKQLRLVVLPMIVLAGAVAAAAWIGQRPEAAQRESKAEEFVLVETVPIEAHREGLQIEVDGSVVPFREIDLATEVAGRIVFKAKDCRAGHFVQEDELLFRIDPEFYQLEVERLTQELNQADIDLEEMDVEAENTESLIELAEEQLALQQRQLQRLQRLSSSRSASSAEQDAERKNELAARNSLLSLKNQARILNTRKASKERAKALISAKLKQAKLDLDRTEVRAPFDAVVLEDSGDVHEYVQPGTTLIKLQDASAIEVRCSLRMEEMRWLWEQKSSPGSHPHGDYELPKTPATIVYRLGNTEYSWKGELSRYDGVGLDERTRTIPCRVVVPEPRQVQSGSKRSGPPALMRGMFVAVRIHVSPSTELFRLPEQAIRPGDVVWLDRAGKLEIVPVEIARIVDGSALVPNTGNELSASDRLIVSPLAMVTPGMPVREVTAK